MTNEEAWNRIDSIIAKYEIDDEYVTIINDKDYDALRMARKILESQPYEDAISRQALIEKATSWDKHFGDSERCVSLTDIQNAPSVTPSYNSIKTELDCVSREEVYDIITRMFTSTEMTNEEYKNAMQLVKELPCVRHKSLYEDIISRIEQVRDMDKNAGEYPYNRCIEIIKEVLGDD